MFYRVEKETCGKGIKSRYTVGQIIDNKELNKIKNDFKQYLYTYYDDMKTTKLEFHDLGTFNNKIFIYYIKMSKQKSSVIK